MSLISRILGTDKAIDAATKGVYNGIDKAFHTSEERAEHFLKLLAAYEPFKLIQRLLAFLVAGVFVGGWALGAILKIGGILAPVCDAGINCFSARAIEAGEWMSQNTLDYFGESFWLIMALYFGGGTINALGGAIKAIKK